MTPTTTMSIFTKHKVLLWSLFIMVVIVFSTMIAFKIIQTPINIIPSKPITTTQKEATEIILTKWVYNQSSKISIQSANLIVKEAMKTNKPLLLLAIIETESNFVPTAVSSKGAIGLTQIMFDTHGKNLIKIGIIKDKRDLFDIIPSIQAGNYIFTDCLNQSKGVVSRALERYLGGQDGRYLQQILSNLANLYVLVNEIEPKP